MFYSMEDQALITRAAQYAEVAHRERYKFAKTPGEPHLRKYTFVPYTVHTQEVAGKLIGLRLPATTVAAAHLHDTIEDTFTTYDDIKYQFGLEVARVTNGVTDVSKPSDGNRAARKKLDRDHLAKGDYHIHSVKLADFWSNTKDIVVNDPDFAVRYLREKELTLPLLSLGDKRLIDEVTAQLAWGKEELRKIGKIK